jgi:GR25 family glycosyltransferase involved in LPS biosynthesis
MNFKVFFITQKHNEQLWLKTKNLFSVLPNELKNSIEKVDAIESQESPSILDNFELKINPIGVVNQNYMRLNPSSVDRYLTHFFIYNKIIKENIDCCIVVEDEVDLSDLINILLLNPDFPDSADICNLSKKGLKAFNSYYITNQGAKKIVNLLLNTKWLNGIKRFSPIDYELPEYFNLFKVFSSEPLQDFSCNNQIIAPIEQLVLAACQFQKIEFSGKISFIRANLIHRTFPILNDLKALNEHDLKYQSSKIDRIFFINLDEDKVRRHRVESMLDCINLPHTRFPAIKLKNQDVETDVHLRSVQEKSMLNEITELFHEEVARDPLQYHLGTLGCYMSHYKLLKSIHEDFSDQKIVLIIEDDCFFDQKSIHLAESVIDSLPSDWDILRSTWSATNECRKIEYSNPLSNNYSSLMEKKISLRKKEIKKTYPSTDPLIHALAGGTHFQIVKVSSIPKILEYLYSEPFLPIDCLYTTNALNVYDHKLNVSHDMFASSNINLSLDDLAKDSERLAECFVEYGTIKETDSNKSWLKFIKDNNHQKFNVHVWEEGGNFFFAGMANYMRKVLLEAGLKEAMQSSYDESVLDIVVAPHEFIYHGEGKDWSEKRISNAIYLNTEQWHTKWFSKSLQVISKSKRAMDMNPNSAKALQALGINAVFFPMVDLSSEKVISDKQFSFQDRKFINIISKNNRNDYKDREIDILYVGAANERRNTALARMGKTLSSYNTFIHSPNLVGKPISKDCPDAIDYRNVQKLARNSKILLNIHRDEHPYFEWHRLFLMGISNGCVVLTEPCLTNNFLTSGSSYVEMALDKIEDTIKLLLDTDQGQDLLYTIHKHAIKEAEFLKVNYLKI